MPALLYAFALASTLAPQDTPSTTDASVLAFLDESTAALYDPTDDGLIGLSFVVPVVESKTNLNKMLAPKGHSMPASLAEDVLLAEVSVVWTQGEGPVVSSQMRDDVPADLSAMIAAAASDLGQQVLSASRHQLIDFSNVLSAYVGKLDGDEDGLLRVTFARKPGRAGKAAPADDLIWLFDEDGLPSRTLVTLQVSSPMGNQAIEMVQQYTWTSPRDDGALVLDKLTVVHKRNGADAMRQETDYTYEERNGVIVLVSYVESMTPLGMLATMRPKAVKHVELTDIQIATTREAPPNAAEPAAAGGDGEG